MNSSRIFKIVGIIVLSIYLLVVTVRAVGFKQVALEYKAEVIQCYETIDSLQQRADNFEIDLNSTLEFLKKQNTKLVDNGIPLY
tara:strand:+ start:2954 stop:3205 length:252 start_codon:yes stop_codon:yes gene_type:complete